MELVIFNVSLLRPLQPQNVENKSHNTQNVDEYQHLSAVTLQVFLAQDWDVDPVVDAVCDNQDLSVFVLPRFSSRIEVLGACVRVVLFCNRRGQAIFNLLIGEITATLALTACLEVRDELFVACVGGLEQGQLLVEGRKVRLVFCSGDSLLEQTLVLKKGKVARKLSKVMTASRFAFVEANQEVRADSRP